MAPLPNDDNAKDDEGPEDDDFREIKPPEGDDDADRLDPESSDENNDDYNIDNSIGESDDQTETYTADEEDDHPRPIYLNPLLLASLSLFLGVVGLITWMLISFDETAYEDVTGPVGKYATLPSPVTTQPGQIIPGEPISGDAVPQVFAAAPGASVPGNGAPAEPLSTLAQAAKALEEQGALEKFVTDFEPDPKTALSIAPDPGLILQVQVGLLPVIGEDGRQPWKVYARPVDLPENIPRIAIVIGGLGMSEAATTAAIQKLPGTVTLAFAPYAPDLSSWIARARAAGHEVLLQLPMEPMDFPANDPGPHTLMTEAKSEENIERLHWLLSRFTGYVGVTNYMGSKMTTSPEAMLPILGDLHSRGLMFLDAMETTDSIAGQLAKQMNMPHAISDRFLDTQASRVGIDARLFELERIAESTGGAVGIGFPYPATIERVSKWIATSGDRKFAIVPISDLAIAGEAFTEEPAADNR